VSFALLVEPAGRPRRFGACSGAGAAASGGATGAAGAATGGATGTAGAATVVDTGAAGGGTGGATGAAGGAPGGATGAAGAACAAGFFICALNAANFSSNVIVIVFPFSLQSGESRISVTIGRVFAAAVFAARCLIYW